MSGFTAIVLAGRRAGEGDPVAVAANVSCKAFAPIAGRPMVERVLAVLRESGVIDRIVICLPDGLPVEKEAPGLARLLATGAVLSVTPDSSPSLSILKALNDVVIDGPILITTADHALLSRDMIVGFVEAYRSARPMAAAAMVPLAVLDAKYPQLRRTRMRFRDGAFKGCNLFIFADAVSARRVLDFWRRMETQRKRPWRMAITLGLPSLVRYLLGRMSLDDAFRRVSILTGSTIRPLLLAIPEAALDVDKVADLEFVRAIAV